jgi:hypothetical protein
MLEDSQTPINYDFEIGLGTGGLFWFRYAAKCDKCGFKFKYNKELQAYTPI